MTQSAVQPLYRRALPFAIFALVVSTLVLSAIFSIADLISMRTALVSEIELLLKLKERVAKGGDKAPLNPNDYLIEAPSQGVATAQLQRRVSELLRGAGADLQLSEIIPTDSEGDAGRLAIAANFEITEERLIDLFFAIENAKPALIIERLSLRILTTGQTAANRRLQGTVTVIAGWRVAS